MGLVVQKEHLLTTIILKILNKGSNKSEKTIHMHAMLILPHSSPLPNGRGN